MQTNEFERSERTYGFHICGQIKHVCDIKQDLKGKDTQSVVLATGTQSIFVKVPPGSVDDKLKGKVVDWNVNLLCFPDKKDPSKIIMLVYKQ